jgi:hypothetical protein
MQGEVSTNQGKRSHNQETFMVSHVVAVILLDQGGDPGAGKQHKNQTGGLEPEGVKCAAHVDEQGLSAGKDRIEQAVFLYNALQSIFDGRNLRHFGYCSAEIAVSCGKNKTQVTSRASNLGGPEEHVVNTRLKQLMKDLGGAINSSLSESEQIAQVIARIKDEGVDVFLVLEATIGFNKHEDEAAGPQLVSASKKNVEPEFSINAHDVRFLKSLRISTDEAA